MNEQELRDMIRTEVRDGVLAAFDEMDAAVPVENKDADKWNEFLEGLFFRGKYKPQ